MKKVIAFVVIIISLASCRGKESSKETKPVTYTNPAAYYSARTNDFSRIFHALKMDPSDIYSSYTSFITH